jgi:hypothetical protein
VGEGEGERRGDMTKFFHIIFINKNRSSIEQNATASAWRSEQYLLSVSFY